jgi:hypothetical protein
MNLTAQDAVSVRACVILVRSKEIKSVHAPGLDLCKRRDVVDRRLHVPHLVRVDHEHRTGRTRILSHERRALCWVPRLVSVWEVLWVVNDRADQPPTPQIVREVSADFHFEVVEAGLNAFFCQAGNFVIRVP